MPFAASESKAQGFSSRPAESNMRWFVCFLLFLATTINYMDRPVGCLVAAPFIDKLGTKIGYAVAIGVWAIASLSHSLVHSVLGFCIARACLGLGESGNFPAATRATREGFASEDRALAVGVFNSGANAAFFIAPAIVPLVALHFGGWRAAFLCTGGMGLDRK